MGEAEMFKQMEMGQLLAEDVLPKVAKEYARVARENGALEAATKKVNSQYQRFLSAMQQAKMAMFDGGFGQAMADSFKFMAKYINEQKYAIVALANAGAGTFQAMSHAVMAFLQPLMLVSSILEAIGHLFGVDGSKWLGYALGVGFLVTKIIALRNALILMNAPLLLASAKILAIAGAIAIAVEGIAYLTTGRTISSRISESYSGGAANKIAQSVSGNTGATQSVHVTVEPNERGFNNLINVHYEGKEQMRRSQLEQGTATV